LALGLTLIVVADSNFAYWSLHNAYATGTLPDVGWSLGYMLVALGAFAAQLAPSEEATTAQDEPGDTPRTESPPAEQRVWPSLLPYALAPAVGVLVVYAWSTSAGSNSLALGVYLGGAVLIGLMLLRQVFTIAENARLFNRLQGTYRQVEQKNDQLVRSQGELRRQEEEVRQLNKDLEKRVAERTEQLKIAMAKQQQEAQERQRIAQELHVARLIQQTLLPKSLPELEDHQIAAYYQPAREVGGDFYDFLQLPDGQLGLIVGDVSGKGVPAAIVMAITRTMLQAAYRMGSPAPGEILEQVNNILYKDIPSNMFVTCLAALLDSRTGRLQYANAGHDPPFVRHASGVGKLRATGMPLGLMPDMIYEQKEITLEHGESILLYSDGLAEAHSPREEMFGFPRIEKFVGAHSEGATLIDSLLAELKRFTGEEWEQEDDITLLTLQRFPS
jgi:serine phosphatase RsbU (regulator of sigma subunit)